MSLIALRQVLRRQGKRAAMLLVALALTPLAAHHAGLPDADAGGPPAHHQPATHGGQSPAGPAISLGEATAVCLAVLPVLLVAALALGLLPHGWLRAALPVTPARSGVWAPKRLLRSPRDGPAVLCVMRC